MKLLAIKMRWDSFTFPIKAGTPVNKNGVQANDSSAIGLVPATIETKPMEDFYEIIVGGVFTLADLEASYGQSYSNEALRNMSGIIFYGSDGTPVPDPVWVPYTLPEATASKLGGVKLAANVAASEATDVAGCVTSINAILTALKNAGVMAADET